MGRKLFALANWYVIKAGYRLMEDLGTKPSVYYLPPVNRNFPFESGIRKYSIQGTFVKAEC
jgi:molybdopterin-containing oxidoreductase family iron-sulfur binding subunit